MLEWISTLQNEGIQNDAGVCGKFVLMQNQTISNGLKFKFFQTHAWNLLKDKYMRIKLRPWQEAKTVFHNMNNVLTRIWSSLRPMH